MPNSSAIIDAAANHRATRRCMCSLADDIHLAGVTSRRNTSPAQLPLRPCLSICLFASFPAYLSSLCMLALCLVIRVRNAYYKRSSVLRIWKRTNCATQPIIIKVIISLVEPIITILLSLRAGGTIRGLRGGPSPPGLGFHHCRKTKAIEYRSSHQSRSPLELQCSPCRTLLCLAEEGLRKTCAEPLE